jgi:hypothetical protein
MLVFHPALQMWEPAVFHEFGQTTMKTRVNKVFGIGLSKTGTTSLAVALRRLGVKTADFPYDDATCRELERGEYRLKLFERYDALTDTPAAAFFAQFDGTYAASKFVLTVRDKPSWLRSVEAHWAFTNEWEKHHLYGDFTRMKNFIRSAMYGCLDFNAERYGWVYDRHERCVLEHFANRPNDLLVLDVCSGEGYGKLCPFLGLPTLDEPFPKANAQDERAAQREWLNHFVNMAGELEMALAIGECVVLIQDFAFARSRLSDKWQIKTFGDTAALGEIPVNDDDACERFARLGPDVRYLVIPWLAFWWPEHYPQLFDAIGRTMERIISTENVWVYSSRSSRQGRQRRASTGSGYKPSRRHGTTRRDAIFEELL